MKVRGQGLSPPNRPRLSVAEPVDPSARLVDDEGRGAHLRYCTKFPNLTRRHLEATGTIADIIKMNVYLVAEVDTSEVPKFRAVRDRYVNVEKPPASTLVVVTRLARPGWLIEIEAVAAIG